MTGTLRAEHSERHEAWLVVDDSEHPVACFPYGMSRTRERAEQLARMLVRGSQSPRVALKESAAEAVVTMTEAAVVLRCSAQTLWRHRGDVVPQGERKAKNGRVAMLYRFGDLAALIERVHKRAANRDPLGFLFVKTQGGQ